MNKLTIITLVALLSVPLAALHAADAIPVQPPSNDHKAPVSLDADKDSKAVLRPADKAAAHPIVSKRPAVDFFEGAILLFGFDNVEFVVIPLAP